MKHHWLPLLWITLLLFSACSQPPPQDLPPTLLWHKDQGLILPSGGTMNIWEGFRVDKDVFIAAPSSSRFILWRRHGKRTVIAIQYSLRAGQATFSANAGKKQVLPQAAAYRWTEFNLPLNPGFNFLEFFTNSKDGLRIKAIRVGTRRERLERHLAAGEGFSVFLPPGRGRLELGGRGQVEITWQQGEGKALAIRSEKLHSGFLSRKIMRELEFSRPGLLTVKAQKGSFDIGSYSYVATAPRRAEAGPPFQGKHDIFFILSDACQASHLGIYGYTRDTSPNIDAFARDAMVYENAYANASFTRSSVATILTGLSPDRHRTHELRSVLPAGMLTLPEFLKSKGYSTCIISANVVNSPHAGFDQGVDAFPLVSQKVNAPRGISIFSEFRRWVEATPASRFCYMHFIHPHFPYAPPPGFPVSFRPGGARVSQERLHELKREKRLARTARSAGEVQEMVDGYDASIAWMDGEFGKILSLLKRKGIYEDSLIVFLADHGEALNEHGYIGHIGNVYDEISRVPLIVKYPREMNLQGRSRPIVELADLFPTVAARFRQPLALDGRDLLAVSPADDTDERIAVTRSGGNWPKYGMRWRDWHYLIDLRGNGEKLFDLAADPRRDVGAARPEIREFLRARFLAWFAGFRNGSGSAADTPLQRLSPAEIEELKTLGYL